MMERSQISFSPTTVQGVLSALMAFATALLPYYPKYATPTLLVIGAAKAALGAYQKDADRVEAIPAGGGSPELVAAHPVPDSPADKVVSK